MVYMLDRCLFLDHEEFDPEIVHTLNRIRAEKHDSKKKMVREQAPPKQLKEYFTPAAYDSPTSTRMPTITEP